MNNLIEAVSAKRAFRYQKNAGDRIRVTRQYINDKSALNPGSMAYVKRWFKSWRESQQNPNTPGGRASFEEKFKNKKTGLTIYAIEVNRQNPSIHIIVYLTKTSPIQTRKGVKLQGGANLFIFDRVFDDYELYSKYLTSLR